jgi:hypothetical protein
MLAHFFGDHPPETARSVSIMRITTQAIRPAGQFGTWAFATRLGQGFHILRTQQPVNLLTLLADFPGPHERQPLENGSVQVRVGHVAVSRGPGGHGSITRRIIGFGVHAGTVDGVALCRMFNRAIRGQCWMPEHISPDNDPLYRFHQWQANLRIRKVTEIKTIPYDPLSHPFVERETF